MERKKTTLKALFRQIRKGNSNREEKELFDRWYEQLDLDSNEGVREHYRSLKEQMLVNIREHIIVEKNNLRRYAWAKVAAAASVVLLMVSVTMLYHYFSFTSGADQSEWQMVSAAANTVKKIQLPDGSQVTLNSKAKLSWNTAYNKKNRTVYLEGEGYFDIAKGEDMPFKVVTDNIETVVLGTSFNIESNQEEDQIHVSLLSGAVKINHINGQISSKVLHPGELAVFNRKHTVLTVKPIGIDDPIAWIKGDLVFNDISLLTALNRVEELYHLRLTVDSGLLKGKTVTAHISRNTDWKDVLQSVLFPHGLTYQLGKSPEEVVIIKQ